MSDWKFVGKIAPKVIESGTGERYGRILAVLKAVAPEQPFDTEWRGCVWCWEEEAPLDPADHDPDCAWAQARRLIAELEAGMSEGQQ